MTCENSKCNQLETQKNNTMRGRNVEYENGKCPGENSGKFPDENPGICSGENPGKCPGFFLICFTQLDIR